jgi:hypothetical protein
MDIAFPLEKTPKSAIRWFVFLEAYALQSLFYGSSGFIKLSSHDMSVLQLVSGHS